MGVLGQRGCRPGADPLGGTVRGLQLGMLCFKLLELTEQAVVLLVRDLRLVRDVVQMIRAVDALAEPGSALGEIGGRGLGHLAVKIANPERP